MTVYLDGVWFINGFVDYLLLVVSGNLTASPIRRNRLLLAGAVGGVYGAICLLPGWSFLGNLLWRVVMAFVLCLVAFGFQKCILRQMVVLFLLTAAFGGVVMLLTEVFSAPAAIIGKNVYYPIDMASLVLTAGGAYGLITWALGRLSHQGGDIVPVQISVGRKSVAITALRDTGNTLRDPVSGMPVMVADITLLKRLTNAKELTSEAPTVLLPMLYELAPELRPRLIPYKAVGTDHGMLVAIEPKEVKVSGKRERVLIAFSSVTVSDGGGYEALLGGAL